MIQKQNRFYAIKCLTNLHVGSGETNFGVVDNLVQRDVNTNLPTIHSSSLKGALREYFSNRHPPSTEKNETGSEKEKWGLLPVFGDQQHAGKWQFLSADLISRPLRSNKAPYFNATSPAIAGRLIQKMEDFKMPVPEELRALSAITVKPQEPVVFHTGFNGAIIEETDWIATTRQQSLALTLTKWLTGLFGENLLLLHPDDFLNLKLPVIARNHLENGESKNLWYEEVVPYDSRFATFIIQSDECVVKFEEGLSDYIQIGGNASIGYGLCKFYNPGQS